MLTRHPQTHFLVLLADSLFSQSARSCAHNSQSCNAIVRSSEFILKLPRDFSRTRRLNCRVPSFRHYCVVNNLTKRHACVFKHKMARQKEKTQVPISSLLCSDILDHAYMYKFSSKAITADHSLCSSILCAGLAEVNWEDNGILQ